MMVRNPICQLAPFRSPATNALIYSESLKNYFSTFGEVQECTVMRDGASGRSRGFGFLTFKDPKVVNVVMVKEHFLDGKIVSCSSSFPLTPCLTGFFPDRPKTRNSARGTGTNFQDIRRRCLTRRKRCYLPRVFHAIWPRRRRDLDDRQGDWPPTWLRLRHV